MMKRYYIKHLIVHPAPSAWWEEGNYGNEQRVYPRNAEDLEIETRREGETFREYMEKDVILYDGEGFSDFTYYSNYEFNHNQRNHPRLFEIRVYKDGKWQKRWTGFIRVKSADFYKKELVCNCEPLDEYSEFMNDLKVDRNIVDVPTRSVSIPKNTKLEFYHVFVGSINHNQPATPPTLSNGFAYFTERFKTDPNYPTGIFAYTSFFAARESIIWPADEELAGEGWVAVGDPDDYNQQKYCRPFGYQFPNLINATIYFNDGCESGNPTPPPGGDYILVNSMCPSIVQGQIYSAWVKSVYNTPDVRYLSTNRLRSLWMVLKYFADQYGLNFQSQIFTSAIIPGTNYQNVGIIQATDFKYPKSDTPATKIEINFEELMKRLEMFQVGWVIKDNTLIIEHYQYFDNGYSYQNQNSVGITLMSGRNAKNQKFTLNQEDLHRYEELTLPGSVNEDFVGVKIEYRNARLLENTSIKSAQCDFYTDVDAFSDDLGLLPDEGLVLLNVNPTTQRVIKGIGLITLEYKNNADLSVANLMERLWTHRRIFNSGRVNNKSTTFESVKANETQEGLIAGCDDEVDPSKLAKTWIGEGFIESITEKLRTGEKEITVKHVIIPDEPQL